MKVWRAVHDAFLTRAWTGQGARLHGGRWNSRGIPLVYSSDHAALSVLEVMANASPPSLGLFRLAWADVPDDEIETRTEDDLPQGWDSFPISATSQAFGDDWATRGSSMALRVPSALVPGSTILLNPDHPRFRAIRPSRAASPIPFAQRLTRRPG
ncbi:MAG: RES family NAD+ phosphorylase [Thermoplasmatota archaeon]